MPRQVLNLGTPTRGEGQPGAESRYESFRKTDENFGELYGGAGGAILPRAVKPASATLALADAGKMVEMDVAAANTLTVPPNSAVAFPVDTVIPVRQVGTGVTTIAAGAGVTVNGSASLTLRTRWSEGTLHKRATDAWVFNGDTL